MAIAFELGIIVLIYYRLITSKVLFYVWVTYSEMEGWERLFSNLLAKAKTQHME